MSRRAFVGAAAVVVFLAVWQLVGSRDIVRSDLISYPSEVVATFAHMSASGELGKNAAVSVLEFVQGYVPAAIVGIAAGVVLALVRPLRLFFDPLLAAIYTAPAIAFIPILVVWFGVGMQSKIVIVFLSAVFPIMINTRTGVVEVAEPWLRAVRAFGATRTQLIVKAILPGSLPAIMAGLRLALGRGIVALIAAEMYVSLAGIGRLIQVYSSAARASEIIVLVVVIAVFGFACVALVRTVEQRLATWRSDFE